MSLPSYTIISSLNLGELQKGRTSLQAKPVIFTRGMLDSKASSSSETQSPFATSDRQAKAQCHFLTPEAEDRISFMEFCYLLK